MTAARPRRGLDALIVAAIVAVGAIGRPHESPHLAGALFTAALALPLLARRRHPVGVFAVVAAVALVQWAADVHAIGDVALLVAFYTVAATQPLRTTVTAAAVIALCIGLAVARWTSGGHTSNALIALTALATGAGLLGVNARNRRALLQSLRDRAARLEVERDQQGRLAASAERARIAREMHDVVAHNLSVMIALADGATYAIHDAPDRAEVALHNLSRTGREALTEMRRLLGVLREGDPGAARAPQPGLGQLDALVEHVRAAGLPTTVTVSGRPPEHVSSGLELAGYRIVQEALTNVIKHGARDARASVDLRWDDGRLRIEVANSGAAVLAPEAEGGGLRGMRERAAVYEGRVSAGPRPDGGWRVAAELVHHASARASA
jgi:signal transduction histidine kinase